MKKITLITLLFTSLIVINKTSTAQDESAFEKGTIVATAGYGFPDFYRLGLRVAYNGYNSSKVSGVGPIIIKGDYGIVKFKWGHSVGAGIVLGYNNTRVKFTDTYYDYLGAPSYATVLRSYSEIHSYSTITVAARGTYHFFTKEKFDCYASVGLGVNINTVSRTTDNPNGYTALASARSGAYSAATLGIRYYFSQNFGVYSELGWDNSSLVQGGIALKF